MTSTAFTFRPATQADHNALYDLAQLDSQRLSDERYTVAEIDGEIIAAVGHTNGNAIADPFRRTAEIVQMLKAHVAPSMVKQTRRHLSVRRPRTALA